MSLSTIGSMATHIVENLTVPAGVSGNMIEIVDMSRQHVANFVGGEIGSKRWLKQFIGINMDESLEFQKDIVGISGATISAKSMTFEINKVLKTVNLLAVKNQL